MTLTRDLYAIRRAQPRDRFEIFAIKTAAFGENYLLYTIFQTPLAATYLEQLITTQAEEKGDQIFVVDQRGAILGYYHAVERETDFFLNYIAVAGIARSSGLGQALLMHFETTGQTCGYRQLGLDVFESNQWVSSWYQRHGYALQSVSFHVRLKIGTLQGEGNLWQCEQKAWAEAIEEEKTRGFSKVDCNWGQGRLTLGLIATRICKLLRYDGISLDEAVSAIMCRFNQEREILILSSLPDIPLNWPLLSVERVLTLRKVVDCKI